MQKNLFCCIFSSMFVKYKLKPKTQYFFTCSKTLLILITRAVLNNIKDLPCRKWKNQLSPNLHHDKDIDTDVNDYLSNFFIKSINLFDSKNTFGLIYTGLFPFLCIYFFFYRCISQYSEIQKIGTKMVEILTEL